MRIAIVSDIHGNRTAFEAVRKDLRETSPDLTLHGGDLAGPGSAPSDIIDQIRDLGWPGVLGNTDEMLFRPESLTEFASGLPHLKSMLSAVDEMAAWTRDSLGERQIEWLRSLSVTLRHDSLALVHATPSSTWTSPMHTAGNDELAVYGSLGQRLIVYGHIHVPFIRRLPHMTVANSGSAGMPYDGDRRVSYLLIDDGDPVVRRVEYDVDKEVKALGDSGLPHADWLVRTISSASPQMP